MGAPSETRSDPKSSFQRFRGLSAPAILSCLDAILDFYTQAEQAGWIAVDFYDGSLLYDFNSSCLRVVDQDMYSDAPFTNKMGRMFGSSRFMAPEEFVLGALIDKQTTVFVMGRTVLVFLSDGTLEPQRFRASKALSDAVAKACAQEREGRFESMASLFHAWQSARLGTG